MYKKHLSDVKEDSTESSSRERLSDMNTANTEGSSGKKTSSCLCFKKGYNCKGLETQAMYM